MVKLLQHLGGGGVQGLICISNGNQVATLALSFSLQLLSSALFLHVLLLDFCTSSNPNMKLFESVGSGESFGSKLRKGIIAALFIFSHDQKLSENKNFFVIFIKVTRYQNELMIHSRKSVIIHVWVIVSTSTHVMDHRQNIWL